MAEDTDSQHKQKMIRVNEAFEKAQSRATREKGLLIVHTGSGKGKTTAALGMAWRALGHGMKVGIVQFIKGAIQTGESALVQNLDLPVEMYTLGEGFTWKTQDRQRDIRTAEVAWSKSVELLRDSSFNMVILDELNVVLDYEYLEKQKVIAEISSRRSDLHVVVTGRKAPPEIIEAADLVSEMKVVKHPYHHGIKAQPGVEF